MSSRKRNEFLDASASEDEDDNQGYTSGAEDVQKGGRGPKRRKVSNNTSDSEAEDDDSDDNQTPFSTAHESIPPSDSKKINSAPEPSPAPKPPKKHTPTQLPGLAKPLTKKNLIATEKAIKRSGVIYLSRIPPFMKPSKLRSLLAPYGALNRIFLTPEDPASHTRRVKAGGNKKRSFSDGWVEFVDKGDAKRACELLNTQTMGGKKGGYYADDVWNLIYLRNFKWGALTEQIAAENAERSGRMRAEISRTTKEDKEFVRNVERAKMLEGMEEKRAARRKKEDELRGGVVDRDVKAEVGKKGGERQRQFKQTALAPKKTTIDQPEDVKRVLSKIFS